MIFPRVWLPEEVDEELADKTGEAISAYYWAHESEWPWSITDEVIKGGIPVDDMINWCKSNHGFDDDIKQLKALKASMAKTS